MSSVALSPWAEIDISNAKGLSVRLESLEGKTIGLFAHFKGHSPLILKEVERKLAERFPKATFKLLQYPKDTKEIQDDPEFLPAFKKWLSQVDCVISAYGDAGSCAMYLAFNTVLAEKTGTPCVLIVKRDILNSAKRGAAARQMPQLRLVACDLPDLSFEPSLDQNLIETQIKPNIAGIIDDIISGLTEPLSKTESSAQVRNVNALARMTFEGGTVEISNEFYRRGFTNGMPIIPPTEDAVEAMLLGTPLARDYVVAELPPMRGMATVEKIAVNAVMAGCLPTYMPALIALVEALAQPQIHLPGWTCSVAGFAPLIVLSGPVSRDIGMNSQKNFLSPYDKPSVAIANALNLIIMNISGVRPGLEDNSYTGHESRLGVCFAENECASPWKPLQTEFGFAESDSTVTLSWFTGRRWFNKATTASELLTTFCAVEDDAGFAPGCNYVISPRCAQILSEAGYGRIDICDYISEYARKPARDINIHWMKRNNHVQRGAILPENPDCSCRKFWNTDHLNIFVAGAEATPRGVMLIGGGDHGGPACARMQLPDNWDELIGRYRDIRPTYFEY